MPEQAGHDDDDDDFTFPTPPPELLDRAYGPNHSSRCSRVSPVLLAPIRRSFSAAESDASMWRSSPRDACLPVLSGHYASGYIDLEEEVMDSLWQDLNDDDMPPAADEGKKDVEVFRASPDISLLLRRSFGEPVETKDRREAPAVQLPASGSSRRRRPAGLAVMMRALKKMLVAHKSRRSKVDEQSGAGASAPPPSSSSRGRRRF